MQTNKMRILKNFIKKLTKHELNYEKDNLKADVELLAK